MLTAGLFVASLGLLVADPRAGLDLTDESLYLLAADNHQPTAAWNGWFGRYTGLLYGMVGHDIGSFRIAGVAIVLVVSVILAFAVIRLLERDGSSTLLMPQKTMVVIGTCAGGLLNYHLFIRSPGYNWLAFVGAMLVGAGLLWVLSPSRSEPPTNGRHLRAIVGPGILLALGCFLALAAKLSAGLALAVLAAAVILAPGIGGRSIRLGAGLVALVGGTLLLAIHFLLIADPATTVHTFQQSFAMLAVVDPRYQPRAAVAQALHDIVASPSDVILLTSGFVFIGLAPLVAFRVRPDRRKSTAAALAMGAVIAVYAVLLVRGEWVGGIPGYPSIGRADMAILATSALSALTASLVLWGGAAPEGRRSRLRVALGGLTLAATAVAYAFGSNNGVIAQSSGAAVLVLLAAALLTAAAFEGNAAGRTVLPSVILITVLSSVVLATARADPYRMLPVGRATQTITFGPHHELLAVDPASTAFWNALRNAAQGAGWTPGTKLLDLTWTPAVPYDLAATVPDTLVPMVGRYETANASAMEALRLSDPARWSDTWLLVSPDISQVDPAAIMAVVGRSFPSEYTLVGVFAAPGLGLHEELWRPNDR